MAAEKMAEKVAVEGVGQKKVAAVEIVEKANPRKKKKDRRYWRSCRERVRGVSMIV